MAMFHERFDIEVGLDEAKRRFVQRVYNLIFEGVMRGPVPDWEYLNAVKYIAARLGDEFSGTYLQAVHGSGDFLRNLHAVEALHEFLRTRSNAPGRGGALQLLDRQVMEILDMSEVDVGVRWEDGRFLPKGAALLDEKLVNAPLRWLAAKGYESVLAPYKKGLEHLLRSAQQPPLRADVITDMYEAIEALAKVVMGNDADLSKNREAFVKRVNASDAYKKLLKQYIEYANDFRHAAEEGQGKPAVSEREAESFVYLTGVFLRLAMP